MIALNVTYQCRPGKRDEFLGKVLAEGIDTASRAEPGNFRYAFYLPADGSGHGHLRGIPHSASDADRL